MKTVSAADANRHFSKLLREVQDGEVVTITSHGWPVARIAPVRVNTEAELEEAKRELLALWSSRKPQNLPKVTRDELYDD
jgi:prevent-host-death family protein